MPLVDFQDTSPAHEVSDSDEEEEEAGVPDTVAVGKLTSPVSAISSCESWKSSARLPPVPNDDEAPVIPEWFRKRHGMIQQRESMRSPCSRMGCKSGNGQNKTAYYCREGCGNYCKDLQGANQNKGGHPRWCYYDHLCKAWMTSGEKEYNPEFKARYDQWVKNREAKWLAEHGVN